MEEVSQKVMKTIIVGKTYRNRYGINLTCTKITEDSLYRYRMESADKSLRYNVDNAGWFVDATKPSDRDIMEEVTEKVEEVMITEAQFMAWAQGKEFLTLSGRIVTLAEVYKGLDFDWTCLPKWANYITLQDDGSWRWFSDKPTISENYNCWVTNNPDPSSHGYIPTSQLPSNVLGYWTNNCHKRP